MEQEKAERVYSRLRASTDAGYQKARLAFDEGRKAGETILLLHGRNKKLNQLLRSRLRSMFEEPDTGVGAESVSAKRKETAASGEYQLEHRRSQMLT